LLCSSWLGLWSMLSHKPESSLKVWVYYPMHLCNTSYCKLFWVLFFCWRFPSTTRTNIYFHTFSYSSCRTFL
jgi:hypothetical protein